MTTNNPTPQPAGECICPKESHTVGTWTARYRLPECTAHGPAVAQPAGEGGVPERVYLPPEVAYAMSADAPPDKGDILYVRASQPATAPSGNLVTDLIDALEGVERNAQMSSTRAYKIRKLTRRARATCATPTDIAERARRAVEKMYKRGWISREVATNDTTKRRLADIIAAEFGGAG